MVGKAESGAGPQGAAGMEEFGKSGEGGVDPEFAQTHAQTLERRLGGKAAVLRFLEKQVQMLKVQLQADGEKNPVE